MGAGIGESVEQENDIGVSLLLETGDVKLAAAQRGPPIDPANTIARGEEPDIAGLDPVAQPRRDVVTETGLGMEGLRHPSDGDDVWINEDRLRLRLAALGDREPRTVPQAQMKGAEAEATAG